LPKPISPFMIGLPRRSLALQNSSKARAIRLLKCSV
jgi:hypothetical protein